MCSKRGVPAAFATLLGKKDKKSKKADDWDDEAGDADTPRGEETPGEETPREPEDAPRRVRHRGWLLKARLHHPSRPVAARTTRLLCLSRHALRSIVAGAHGICCRTKKESQLRASTALRAAHRWQAGGKDGTGGKKRRWFVLNDSVIVYFPKEVKGWKFSKAKLKKDSKGDIDL